MKWLFIVVFIFMLIFGGLIIFQEENQSQERREVTKYMKSKGASKPPRSWRHKMGQGI
jgi:uncharacterized membrane-anchored protein